jgi:amidophosphoribosyltransferase
MWPCFYGIDFASRAELIASGMGVEQIRASIGADSLAFVSLEGLTAASSQRADRLCRACFDGSYPIPVPERELAGKHVLEGAVRPGGVGRPPRASSPQPADHRADHDHAASGQVVVHNGLATVDRMDAVLGQELEADAMARP